MPEVTVVVPTHNRSTLLQTTLRSVLAQRAIDLEVVVVDDGSTDATAAVVSQFRDARLRTVRHDVPHGVSAARNAGGAHARGEWVSFCDDDDVWAPDKLAQQVTAARHSELEWAYSGVVNVDSALRPISAPPTPSPEEVMIGLPGYNAIPGGGSNVLVSRDLLVRAGPFDTGLRNTEDWEMWLRLSRLARPAVAERRLVGYRVHLGNASLDVSEILRGIRRIERRHGVRVDRGRIHRWLAESSLRRGHRTNALLHWALASGHGQMAPVLADVKVAVLRRLDAGHSQGVGDVDAPAWVQEARQWLDALIPEQAVSNANELD